MRDEVVEKLRVEHALLGEHGFDGRDARLDRRERLGMMIVTVMIVVMVVIARHVSSSR